MIRRPPRSTLSSSSAASDVYKRQLDTLRKNRATHRHHLYEHDVIDACKRMWFTPKASKLYRNFFKHLEYEEAKALAHDKPRLMQLRSDHSNRMVTKLRLEMNQFLDRAKRHLNSVEGLSEIHLGDLNRIKLELKENLQDAYSICGEVTAGKFAGAARALLDELEGVAQLVSRLGSRASQTAGVEHCPPLSGRCYVLLSTLLPTTADHALNTTRPDPLRLKAACTGSVYVRISPMLDPHSMSGHFHDDLPGTHVGGGRPALHVQPVDTERSGLGADEEAAATTAATVMAAETVETDMQTEMTVTDPQDPLVSVDRVP
eukprot:TRINITY_DN17837_c0_g1_i2.p1 TRINITY_DN17837_c0_g1~~TRINITY_DN17837_c0_g1_i2.p1  ORF type:complete len:317 (+),score=62.85 TRINITY_DN17837_c0_g1_i2:121-1071(+)